MAMIGLSPFTAASGTAVSFPARQFKSLTIRVFGGNAYINTQGVVASASGPYQYQLADGEAVELDGALVRKGDDISIVMDANGTIVYDLK